MAFLSLFTFGVGWLIWCDGVLDVMWESLLHIPSFFAG